MITVVRFMVKIISIATEVVRRSRVPSRDRTSRYYLEKWLLSYRKFTSNCALVLNMEVPQKCTLATVVPRRVLHIQSTLSLVIDTGPCILVQVDQKCATSLLYIHSIDLYLTLKDSVRRLLRSGAVPFVSYSQHFHNTISSIGNYMLLLFDVTTGFTKNDSEVIDFWSAVGLFQSNSSKTLLGDAAEATQSNCDEATCHTRSDRSSWSFFLRPIPIAADMVS